MPTSAVLNAGAREDTIVPLDVDEELALARAADEFRHTEQETARIQALRQELLDSIKSLHHTEHSRDIMQTVQSMNLEELKEVVVYLLTMHIDGHTGN